MNLLWIVFACGEPESPSTETVSTISDVVLERFEREIDQGNVLVRMTVSPKMVRLGDPFTLDLEV